MATALNEKTGNTPQSTPQSNGTSQSVKDRAQEAAKASGEAIRETAENVKETGAQLAEQGKEQLSTLQTQIDDVVRRNPTTAVLGAVGIGVLIGMALRQRS